MVEASKYSNIIFNTVFQILILIASLIISVSSLLNFGRISTNNLNMVPLIFGAVGGAVAFFITAGLMVLQWYNKQSKDLDTVLHVGGISENPFIKIFNHPVTRLSVHLVWVIIVLFLALGKFQIWGIPDAFKGVQEFSTSGPSEALSQHGFFESFFHIAFIPAISEDISVYALGVAFVMFFMLILWFIHKRTNSDFFKPNNVWLAIIIFFVCPVVSFGLGVIPGFAQAHADVQGGNYAFSVSAWFFQTVNQWVFWYTGLVFPMAHMVHNGVYALGYSFSFSIALSSIWFIFRLKGGDKREKFIQSSAFDYILPFAIGRFVIQRTSVLFARIRCSWRNIIRNSY